MCLPITLIQVSPLDPKEKAVQTQSERDTGGLATPQRLVLQGRQRQDKDKTE